jgi:hypothetical protein
MDTETHVITLHYPKGKRWRSLLSLPEVANSLTTLNQPVSKVTVILRPDVDKHRLQEIVQMFAEVLDAGSGIQID